MPKKHKSITITIEGALCIALCIVLDKINIFSMPQGGSVDFGLVPLLLFTYRRGFRWGVFAGFLAGMLKIVIGGYFLNVAQFALDYPLGYMCVGLAAIHPKIIGLIISALGKIACSVVSGVLFYSQNLPEGTNPLMFSIMYNAPTLSVKYIISGIIALFLWKVLERDLPVID